MRVLFIDDETVNLRLGKRFLERLGCTYTMLEDGETAVEEVERAIAEGNPFNVVLVDIVMARVGGVAVCEAIRKRQIPVPVVAMTAVTGRANLMQFKKVGFNLVLAKPFGADAVKQALVEAAKRERRRAEAEAAAAAQARRGGAAEGEGEGEEPDSAEDAAARVREGRAARRDR